MFIYNRITLVISRYQKLSDTAYPFFYAGAGQGAKTLLSHACGGGFHLENIPGFYAGFKKLAGHKLFFYSFAAIADSDKANPVPLVIFGEYVEILDFTYPAFYTVTLHIVPPYCLIIGAKNKRFNKRLPDGIMPYEVQRRMV